MSTKVAAEKTVTRASDFRFVATDAIGFSLNDNIAKIVFGIEEFDSAIHEQMGAAMPLGTLKVLWFILNEAIAKHEAKTGVEIPMDPAKIDALRKVFSQTDDESVKSE